MKHIINMYRSAFLEHGDSNKSVFWPKGKQENRFEALCQKIEKNETFSILDFGCGLGDLYKYLNERYTSFNYTGVDIVEDFVSFTRDKFLEEKSVNFYKIENSSDIKEKYDYIVSSGTFNVLFEETFEEHFTVLKNIFIDLFEKTNVYLAINFLNKDVDYIQDGAYHQDVMELYNFITKNLSKRVIIDQSYMPYEFTIIIYKDQSKEENVYQMKGKL